MDKTFNYPTQEWIDRWIDGWMDKHPDERVEDFGALREQAEMEWWDNEVEHGRPAPFDLDPAQEKEAHEVCKGMARAVNPYGKEVKRVRKPNEDKRELMRRLLTAFPDAELTNPERQIDFTYNGTAYSVTLTAHRPPKK